MTSQARRSRTRQSTHDLRLKIAIIESRRTQRRIALETRIGEVRFSQIVGGRGTPPTDDEKRRIAKHLNRPIEDLFDVETMGEPDDAPPALADDAERAS